MEAFAKVSLLVIEEFQSSAEVHSSDEVEVEVDFDSLLPLSLEAGFSALLSLLPDFSLLFERLCPEGER